MSDEQYQNFKSEMKSHLEEVIQAKINGKIDALKLQSQINSQKMDTFIDRATPVVQVFENLTWLRKTSLGILVSIASLVGLVESVKTIFKK